MKFSDIVGSAANHLRGEMQSARVVHAYLFAGPAGTGKRSLADICARALLCTGPGEKPCDDCPSCKQFLSGNHPDMHRISPEKSIGVEVIRELPDYDKWVEAVQPVWEQYGAGLEDKIEAIQAMG